MSTGSCTVTPGIVFADADPLEAAGLNLGAQPTVRVDAESIGARELKRAEVITILGTGAAGANYLGNPNFAEVLWSRGYSPVNCPAGTQTFRADDWWVICGGGGASYGRQTAGPNFKSLHSALISGGVAVTATDFGQDILEHIAAALAAPLYFSFWIYNNTGAAFTPLVLVDTCDSANNFGAVTNRFSAPVSAAVGNAAWTLCGLAIDCTALTNIAHGLRIRIRVPAGSLDSAGKSVAFAQMKLELGTSPSEFVVPRDVEPPAESSGSGSLNFFHNPGMSAERWASYATPLAATASTDVSNADGWFVRAGAGASLATVGPGSSNSVEAPLGMLITGGAGTTTVDIGQNIEPSTAATLGRDVVVSAWIENLTGTAFRPTLVLFIPTVPGDFAGSGTTTTQALDVCANTAYTRVSVQVDLASLSADPANGVRVSWQIPTGSLDGAGKSVTFAQPKIELGLAATDYTAIRDTEAPLGIPGTSSGLAIDWLTTTTLSLAFSTIILDDGGGRQIRARMASGTSVTVNGAASGANGLDTGSRTLSTWYYIWVISNGTAVRGLLSLSSTAPTLPAGYRFRALVGVVRSNASNNFIQFAQRRNRVSTVPIVLFTAKGPVSANVYESAKLAAGVGVLESVVPPIASAVRANVGRTTTGNALIGVASIFAGLNETLLTLPSATLNFSSFWNPQSFEVPILSAQDFQWKADTTSAVHRMEVSGYSL